jgi:hypothetical protein
MNWRHLDRFAANDRDLRLLDHAAYLYRDGLMAVPGLGGPVDAMGLGWVINLAVGNRPLILQKSGGLQGYLCILAILPPRGGCVFRHERVQYGWLHRRRGRDQRADRSTCARLYPLVSASGHLSIRPSASRPPNP